MLPTIYLASASPRRQALLKQAGIPFFVVENKAKEESSQLTPQGFVMDVSEKKALSAVEAIPPDSIVIGADTVVTFQGRQLGKPKDAAEAGQMLRLLSGQRHVVYTGVTLLWKQANGMVQTKCFISSSAVIMQEWSAKEMDQYLQTGEPWDKAGAYAIQGHAALWIEKIEGDYNTVVGLPLNKIFQELKSWGINLTEYWKFQ